MHGRGRRAAVGVAKCARVRVFSGKGEDVFAAWSSTVNTFPFFLYLRARAPF